MYLPHVQFLGTVVIHMSCTCVHTTYIYIHMYVMYLCVDYVYVSLFFSNYLYMYGRLETNIVLIVVAI